MAAQLKFPYPIDRDDSFDTFILDEKNGDTVRLCEAFVSGEEGQPSSLVLYGPRGSGKTHLLGAMGALAKETINESAALYLDCDKLNEKVSRLKTYGELKAYLESYEKAAFLALDNLDAVSGISEAEEQVFHLYNAVTQSGGRFSAALTATPSTWRFLDELATRLLWGQVLELKPVGDDQRGKVLEKMARDSGMTLPGNVAAWLITRIDRDPESQREALARIDLYSLEKGRKVSIQLIREALQINDGF